MFLCSFWSAFGPISWGYHTLRTPALVFHCSVVVNAVTASDGFVHKVASALRLYAFAVLFMNSLIIGQKDKYSSLDIVHTRTRNRSSDAMPLKGREDSRRRPPHKRTPAVPVS